MQGPYVAPLGNRGHRGGQGDCRRPRGGGEHLDDRAAAILTDTKKFYNAMTDDEALVYTRAAYPDVAGGQGAHETAGQRAVEDVLIGLVGKGMITTGHVAELLRRGRADVMRMVSVAGMPVFIRGGAGATGRRDCRGATMGRSRAAAHWCLAHRRRLECPTCVVPAFSIYSVSSATS